MAEPTELVQVIKQESAALGGDAADTAVYDTPINPFEDVIEAAGVALQEPGGVTRDQGVKCWRDGNVMKFRDGENGGPVSLTEIMGTNGNADFGLLIFTSEGGIVYTSIGDVALKAAP